MLKNKTNNENTGLGLLRTVLLGTVLLMGALLPPSAQASSSGVSTGTPARPAYTCGPEVPEHAPRVRWPNAEYTETSIDLSLKVAGGRVEIARSWQQGRWHLNAAWAPLDFELDPLGSSVKVIGRAGVLYERTGGSDVYIAKGAQQEPVYIKQSATGWQWYDRLGNTINYDTQGRIVSYARPTGLKVSFAYDDASQARILSAQGTTLYTVALADGVATSVTDRAGRTVQYTWSGAKESKRLEVVKDARGSLWQYTYDGNGQITSRTDPAGGVTTIRYAQSIPAPKAALALGVGGVKLDPSTGNTLKLQNVWGAARVGNFVDCLGTLSGSVEWIHKLRLFKAVITDNKGNSKTFFYPPGTGLDTTQNSESYDAYQNRLSQSLWDGKYQERYANERGDITTTTYNFNYQPTRIVYADGSVETNEYDEAKGLKIKSVNPLGVITQWKYDTKGSVTEQIEAVGTPQQRKTTWQYDQWGQATQRTLGEGAEAIVWQYRYDDWGNVAELTDPTGDVWKYTYTPAGDVASSTDPLGRITQYEYDAAGNTTKVATPKGSEYKTAYSSRNQPSELTDALGRKSLIAYNNQGQVTSATNAKGQVAQYTYNEFGNPTAETSPAGNATKFEHDKKGRVIAIVDPAGNRIAFEHGDNGSVQADVMTAMVLPGGTRQEFKYDQRGRTTLTTLKASGLEPITQSNTYNALGQIVASTNAAGQTSQSQYDPLGRLTQFTDAAGQVTRITYNLLDQTTSVEDALGNVHRYRYDKAGQLLEESRPEGGKTTYQHDKAGQLTLVTDADGNQTQYAYDADGNLTLQTRTSAADNTLNQSIAYTYDANGDLTGYTQKDSLGKVISQAAYTLDELGRASVETITYGEGASAITRSLTREWDADWNTTRIGYGSKATEAEYAKGQLKNIKTPDGKQIQITKYNWNQPQTIEYPGSTRTQNYDGYYRPSAIDVKGSNSQTLLKLGYQYSKNSNIARQSIEQPGVAGTISYQYDALDRLIQAQPSQPLVDLGLPQEGYGYDAVGNRTSSSHQSGPWQYGAGNRLVQKGDTSYTYTASGHLQSATRAGVTRNYTYDSAQRLVRVSEAGKTVASYQYDPAGRRISKTVGDGSTAQTTWFVYDAEGLAAEVNSAGATVKTYGWVPGTPWGTGPVWQQDHASTANGASPYHYLHTDHLERPLAATGEAGNPTWQALSESFGQTLIEQGSATQINLRLPGQYWDAETGTHYNQQRDYDPSKGRYIQSDPLGLYDGVNTFAYGYGNPIENTDPTGEAVPVFLYAKCVIECKATDALLAAVKSECDPRTLGDCAKECINPLNWAKIPGLKLATKARQTTKPSLPKKTFVPDSYYRKETRVADDLAPGIRDSVKLRIGSDGKEYLQTSHYDDYGRLVARTDHTSHPSLKPTHPDPHHHRYEYTPGSNGGSVKNPNTAPGGSPNVWPGAYR